MGALNPKYSILNALKAPVASQRPYLERLDKTYRRKLKNLTCNNRLFRYDRNQIVRGLFSLDRSDKYIYRKRAA